MASDVMPNWLEKRAQLSPNRKALITDSETWTFVELHEKALRVARKLMTLGIKKGDHVAILMDNRAEFVAIIHGIEYIGAVAVLLNTRLTSYELAWQLNDSASQLLIYHTRFLDKIEKDWLDKRGIAIENFTDLGNLESLDEISNPFRSEWDLNDLHTIIYTSGTTGKPKGVMLTYGNHWWSAVGSSLNLGLHNDDCWLCCLPLFHVGGLSILIRSVVYGIPVVLHEKFEPRKINYSIVQNKVTIISIVSQMLTRMIADIDIDRYPSELRCVLLGGGPASKPLLEDCKQRGIPVFQTYGMTETSSQIVTLSSEYMLSKLGSAGKPLFQAQLRIEIDGRLAKPDEAGEIVVKGPNVAKGYWNRQTDTKTSIKGGWLYTGDIGYLDDDGFLFVLDRRSDLIISGGENVYPAEIESVLLAHPAVAEAGVIGLEDEKWGQVPVAFIKRQSSENVNESELQGYCRERLAKYKVPTNIYFVEELPRNASNKLVRHKLKELL